MRFKMLFFLVLIVSPPSLFAKSLSSRMTNEWILVDRSPQTHGDRLASWEKLRRHLNSSLKFVKSFGPGDRFVLIRGLLNGSEKQLTSSPNLILQPNYIYRTLNEDPDFGKSWGLENTGDVDAQGQSGCAGKDIAAIKAWEISTGKASTIVAVVDSGIAIEHEDLKNNIWVNPREIAGNQKDDDGNGYIDDINGWNFVDNSANVTDTFDHGTMAAGIIGSTANNGVGTRGVNWEISMMSVKAIDNSGLATTESAIAGIHYAVQNGAKIINTSWGQSEYDTALSDEITYAGNEGVLIVAAAGNYAKDNDSDPEPMYPAAFRLPNIISVAAYDHRDKLADFSNYGPQSVHIGAPGVGIYTTSINGYKFGDGTSFAAPFVTGVAALLKSYLPDLSAVEIKERILATSEVIDYYQKTKTVTGGRVSAYNALANIRPPRPSVAQNWVRANATAATPHPYAAKSHLKYDFNYPGAHFIRVHFSGFASGTCCDKATIKDSVGRVVAIYSGALGDFTSAEAVGETLQVDFESGAVGTANGFDVDYLEYSLDEN